MVIKKTALPTKLYKSKWNHYIFVSFFILSTSLLVMIYIFSKNKINDSDFTVKNLRSRVNVSIEEAKKRKIENVNSMYMSCNFFTCFNIYRCGNKGNQLLVYIYPYERFAEPTKMLTNSYLTKEFHAVLETISASKYYTSNPDEACIFVPSIDMVNPSRRNLSEEGKNHLIFHFMFKNLNNYKQLNYTVNQAMIAGMGNTKSTYRKNFDISFPTVSTLAKNFKLNISKTRKWLAISSQLNIHWDINEALLEVQKLFPKDLRLFYSCSQKNYTNQFYRCINHKTYKYLQILQTATFCLVVRGEKLSLSVLLDSIASKCIPVIIFDDLVMPFDEVIDWSRAAVFVREVDIDFAINVLRSYSSQRIKELQDHGTWLYERYFKTLQLITDTTFDIIANRIFPHSGRNYYFWNEPEHSDGISPVFLPPVIPKNNGFTAVILTYDRIDLLFLLVRQLSKVPSLTKILIVWNNKYKKPPHFSKWPKIYKSMKIIHTEKNALSNRFYPFDEIETEAILSIDDDIIMLTEDEIEFAFEVWREFPDRIVGFPSRTHTWDNATVSWKYQSEWTNHVSMVLTGAAFYHKFWNYAYTTRLPRDVKEWVERHMNCEDIAMNFLVSNVTRKAPIKVTAKKKFRCPECVNTEMLSADLTHMLERTQCINQFTRSFSYMPLMSVEFRADPVLFKDNFPDKLKRFNNVGRL